MSAGEYLGAAKSIIILWTFNVLLQLFVSGVKFLKFRNEVTFYYANLFLSNPPKSSEHWNDCWIQHIASA